MSDVSEKRGEAPVGGRAMFSSPPGFASMMRGPAVAYAPEGEGGAAAGGEGLSGAASLLSDSGGNGGGDGGEGGANGGGNDAGNGAAATFERPSWIAEGADAETLEYLSKKGFKSPDDLLASYRNLEKFQGGEKIPVPKGPDDIEGLNRVYTALGRPETPDGYDLGNLQAADPDFAKLAAGWLHEVGASKTGALALAEKWNSYVEGVTKAAQADFAVQSKNDMGALRTEWGQAFPAETENFRRAVATFGMEKDEVTQLEQALGTKRTVTLLAKIGKALGEDTFVEGEGNRGFGMTPEAAKARIKALQADKEWGAKFMNGDTGAKEEWARLNKIVADAAGAES